MKTCSRCREAKPVDQYCRYKKNKDGLHYWCKPCRLEKAAERKDYARQWYERNKERCRLMSAERHQRTKGRKAELRRARERRRRIEDPEWAMIQRLRARLREYLRANHAPRASLRTYLKCSPKQLRQFLEFQFEDGMTWENRHLWHVDHVIPLSWANPADDYQMSIVLHFSNLQPLWAADNQKKAASL